VQEEQMKTVENLGTSLLLMLQLLPAQQLAAARGAVSAAAANGAGASPAAAGRAALAAESPAELLELQMALLELLPTLCKAAAQAVSQQQGAAADAGGAPAGSSVADLQARESYVAVLLELLKEILWHQLQPDAWREPVLRHLDLVAMVQAAAARVNSLAGPAQAGAAAAAGSATDSGGSSGAAAAAAAGVTDISVLEVLQVCLCRRFQRLDCPSSDFCTVWHACRGPHTSPEQLHHVP
jgi:hypothetical protein